MKQKIQKHFLFRIITRLDVLLFLYIIAFSVVYVVGNFKFYIDEILVFLTMSITYLGIFLLVFSVISIILSIVFFIREKKNIYLYYIFLYVFFIVFSIIIILATRIFELISAGIA